MTYNYKKLKSASTITGSISGIAPSAGIIGQQIRGYFSSVGVGAGVASTIGSISLTAGVWDVSGVLGCIYSAGTGLFLIGSISTTASNLGTVGDNRSTFTAGGGVVMAEMTVSIPSYRILLSSTTTVYLNASSNFSSGTGTCNGRLSATRVG